MSASLVYLILGLALLLAAVLPSALERYAVSAPIVLLGLGMGIGLLPLPEGLVLDPVDIRPQVERVTELAVLVALMGVGLALDRPLSFRDRGSWIRWSPTWRLLAVAMPLTIAAVAAFGWLVGLAPAAALLLGAALSPTDPVLAEDVQVGGPQVRSATERHEDDADGPGQDGGDDRDDRDARRDRGDRDPAVEGDPVEPDEVDEEDEARFALTSEAGLNDGLAFPFVHAALFLATAGSVGAWIGGWLAWELVGKVVVGVAVGVLVGWTLAKAAFRARRPSLRLAEQGEPLLAIAALVTTYGLSEVVGGYGFLAVFACGMTIRAAERQHEYHAAMHEVVSRLERLLTLIILMVLGMAMTNGILDALDWRGVAVGLLLVLVVRPLTGWFALSVRARRRDAPGGMQPAERRAAAFFGVRGIGTLYYIAYAAGHHAFAEERWLWATAAFTIGLSVVVHGVLATPVLRRVEQRRVEATR